MACDWQSLGQFPLHKVGENLSYSNGSIGRILQCLAKASDERRKNLDNNVVFYSRYGRRRRKDCQYQQIFLCKIFLELWERLRIVMIVHYCS